MKLLYVTNIPTPYRNKRYNVMNEIFPKYDIDFEVLYMAAKQSNRQWEVPEESYSYNYQIFKGFHPQRNEVFYHYNPSLLKRLKKNDFEIVVIGGLTSPTHWLAPYNINKKALKILSVESNLESTRHKSGMGFKLKKTLTKKYDAYQITGYRSKVYVNWLLQQETTKPFITLPNLIDEQVFVNDVSKAKKEKEQLRNSLGIKDHEQLWVCPARLEPYKGLDKFLHLLENIENIKLLIAGEGNQKDDLNSLISSKQLPVELVGFQEERNMINLYAAADLFVLPSMSDPSPLSPIEASASQLPLLVSERIGNFEDVVEHDYNGWGFNPIGDIKDNKILIHQISKMTRDELAEKGAKSSEFYNRSFNTRNCIRSYAEQLISVYKQVKVNA